MHSFGDRHGLRVPFAVVLACSALISLPAIARAQSATQAAAKDLTVERLYSDPSLSGEMLRGLAWTADGKQVSYLRHAQDGTELVVVDAATGESRVLVDAKKLALLMPRPKKQVAQRTGFGRAAEARYLWSPDGKSLLFIGGGNLVLFNTE
ncbi:MAG TPA: hypothetical protein VMV59_11680, partial [Candidatus Dormibacteraeota bacterium]|nr:hypothetical protein [Candidatus Dormibacteraeota bacterium]